MQLNKNVKIDTCNDNIYICPDGLKQVICLNKSAAQVIDWENKKINSVVEKTMRYFSNHNKEVSVRSTVLKSDYNKIHKMVSYIFDNYSCVTTYHLEPLQSVGRGENISCIYKSFLNSYYRAKNYVRRNYKNKKLYCSLFDYRPKNVFCTSMTGETPVIDNEGKVMPCSDLMDYDKYALGEIKEGDFSSIGKNFYKDLYIKICNTSCGVCKYFYLCGGGCPSTIKRNINGTIQKESISICKQVKKFWNHEFRNLSKNNSSNTMKLKKIESTEQFNLFEISRM